MDIKRQLGQQGQHVVSVLLRQGKSATSEPHGKKMSPLSSNYLVIVWFMVATLKIVRKLVQKIIKSCALLVVLHCS